MECAKIFSEDKSEIVTAQEVSLGIVSRDAEFVDPEEDFRVIFVSASKNGKSAHFRLYYSRQYYDSLNPERRKRYDYVRNLRHFQDSEWHQNWEAAFRPYAKTEAYVRDPESKTYKRADVYFENIKLAVEFQHSYIANDFAIRNDYYSKLGIDTIWLYDLTDTNVVKSEDGKFRVLENNAKGFFRIAEDADNLLHHVYVEAKDQKIYRIQHLERKQIDGDIESTIRVFDTTEIYTKQEFIDKIVNNAIFDKTETIDDSYDTIFDLWDKSYYYMVVMNTITSDHIVIFKDSKKQGEMKRDSSGTLLYQYVTWDEQKQFYSLNSKTYYRLRNDLANTQIWVLVRAFIDSSNYNNLQNK